MHLVVQEFFIFYFIFILCGLSKIDGKGIKSGNVGGNAPVKMLSINIYN